jgi:hypothetical protein
VLSTIALTFLTFHPQPLPLDNLSLDRARILDGKRVLVSILVTKPPDTLNGSTIIGTDDKPAVMWRRRLCDQAGPVGCNCWFGSSYQIDTVIEDGSKLPPLADW